MKNILRYVGRLRFLFTCGLVMLISAQGVAQQDSLNSLMKRFDAYRKSAIQEKIFIHSDRSAYLTGEIMWLKVYCIDAVAHEPLTISKVVYVDVIDTYKKSVLQSKIELDERGHANASLFIPASVASGNYTMRAYTSWMKNSDPGLYFHQPLVIVNPFTTLGLKPGVPPTTYDVQFFPEGGNLVRGLTSKVAFRAVDNNGKGIDFAGMIVNENNETVATFSPTKFGIGTFYLKPQALHTYKAVVFDKKGKEFRYDLPTIQDYGYVLTVADTFNNQIVINVQSKPAPSDEATGVYMFSHTRGIVSASSFGMLYSGRTRFFINKKKMGDGITHITLFNTSLKPVCERLYFNTPSRRLRVDAYPDQSSYDPRMKVSMNLQTAAESGSAIAASLSVAVYKVDSLSQQDPQSITSFLWLGSELKGNIESPSYYADQDNKEVQAVTDNLMLTHGWRRFQWSEILTPGKKSPTYLPEHEKHIITGRVLNAEGKPTPYVPVYLASPGKIIRTYSSKSNEEGRIKFEMQNFYGQREIVAQMNASVDSLSQYRIEITSPFDERIAMGIIPAFDVSEKRKDDIEQRSIHMQVQRSFYEPQMNTFLKPVADSVAFFGKPDESYLLDDYTRFPTMEEVMREYVPGVLVRKRAGKFHFLTLDDLNHSIFKENPLVLVDGIPVFDIDKIIAFDPRKIKRLEVLRQRFFNGPMAFDGIVSYGTYTGDLAGFELDPKSVILPYEGLQLQREFFMPVYETTAQHDSPKPDARNLLYWAPNVQTSAEGKSTVTFYTSDVSGKYRIVVQGITRDGRPGQTSQTIEVKNKKNY